MIDSLLMIMSVSVEGLSWDDAQLSLRRRRQLVVVSFLHSHSHSILSIHYYYYYIVVVVDVKFVDFQKEVEMCKVCN